MRGLKNIIDLTTEPNFWINDIGLFVPPTSISIHKEGLAYSMKTLRSRVSTKVLSGNGIYHAQINLTFPPDSLIQLHRLICQIKNNPFVFVKNSWIKTHIDNVSESANYFTVVGLNIINHPSSIGSFNVELDLRYFNEKIYDPNLRYSEDWGYKVLKNNKEVILTFSCSEEINEVSEVILDEREISKDSLSIRTIDNTIALSKEIYSPIETIGVKEPKDSKAYVRYSNYLQNVSLEENFNIKVKELKSFPGVKEKRSEEHTD